MGIKVIVDSTADLRAELKDRVTVVPLTVHFGEEEYLDGVTMDYVKFYEKLATCEELPTTSQPNPAVFESAIKEAAANGDSVIVITLASKLSGTCQSATIAASDYDNVYVVDGCSAAIGTGVLVQRAFEMIDAGMEAEAIVDVLNVEKKKVKIVALIDTLEFLQRGGRISKTVALAGSVLSIKPIIAVQNGTIEMIAKVRGQKQGFKQIKIEAEKLGEIDFEKPVMFAFTGSTPENLEKYEAAYADAWAEAEGCFEKTPLGAVIGTHIGPGAVAVAYFVK